jgi:hypothetical protein
MSTTASDREAKQYQEYLTRCRADERALRELEGDDPVKRGPHLDADAVPDKPDGRISFVAGDSLKVACLRVLTQLPVNVEDLVRGLANHGSDWAASDVRETALGLLADHNYVRVFDFLGSDPDRYMLAPGILTTALAAARPPVPRSRLSPLAG